MFLPRSCSLSTLRLAGLPTQWTTPTAAPSLLLSSTRDHYRHFSSSPFLANTAAPTPNHYEVLKLPHNATHAELKRQFYVLSKETHPDHNRDDPDASTRFAQISESYSVLANPEKRKRYDRDVLRTHRSHQSHRSRSSESNSYAGSRPATGLSRRRSAFKGPPPSFYAHGNPSANTAKQAQSHTQTSQPGQEPYVAGTFNAGAYTEYGQYDTPFNASSVYRTQTHEDYRRANRRAAELASAQAYAEDEGNFWTRFIVVSGILVLGISLAGLIAGKSSTNTRGGLIRGDGSRRDAMKK